MFKLCFYFYYRCICCHVWCPRIFCFPFSLLCSSRPRPLSFALRPPTALHSTRTRTRISSSISSPHFLLHIDSDRFHSIPIRFDSGGMSQSHHADGREADSDAPAAAPASDRHVPSAVAPSPSSSSSLSESTRLDSCAPPSLHWCDTIGPSSSSSLLQPLLSPSSSSRSVTLKLRVAGLTRRFRVPFDINYQQLCKEIAAICKLNTQSFRIHYSVSRSQPMRVSSPPLLLLPTPLADSAVSLLLHLLHSNV